MPDDSDFERGKEGFNAYRGSIDITSRPRNVHSGHKALEWTYTIVMGKVSFISKGILEPGQFLDKIALKLWVKSDKAGPLLFHLVERDDSVYQYLDNAAVVTGEWQEFTLPIERFRKDPDVADENNRLDREQIKEFWIVDVSGYFQPHLAGPRTVWVDDIGLVGATVSAAQTVAPAREDGEVIPSGPIGSANNLKSDPTVLKDGGLYKMWYGGNSERTRQQVFYATSKDGRKWNLHARPVLSVGSEGAWDAADIETPAVVKVGGVYHLWYSGRARSVDGGDRWIRAAAYKIGHGTSQDGIHWTKDPNNPVIKLGNRAKNEWNWAAAAEPSVIYSPTKNRFEMWYVGANVLGGQAHFHIGYASSKDGSNWVHHAGNPVIDSQPSRDSGEYNGYFAPNVVRDRDRYLIFYATDTWNGQPIGPLRVGTSTDGLNWKMNQGQILSKGPAESWNGSGVFGPAAIVEDERIRLWYTGFQISMTFRFGIGYASVPGSVLP